MTREWDADSVAFESVDATGQLLCLHDSVAPRRDTPEAVDLDRLLAGASPAFDCVLVGDEHRPDEADFETGYTFAASDGTPVLYTGPSVPISSAYDEHSPFVTELTISSAGVETTRHEL